MKIAGHKLLPVPATPVTIAVLTLALACAHSAMAQTAAAADDDVVVKGAVDHYDGEDHARKPETAAQVEVKKKYSPYAGRKYPTRVFFGDTHHHTMNSGDAFAGGNRLGPEEAYRLARGEEVVTSTGIAAKMGRPLDFLVISDHAEGLGLMAQVYEGNPALASDPLAKRWGEMMKAGGAEAAKAANEIVSAQSNNKLPPVVKDPKVVGPIMKSVWEQYTALAEKYNEPGRFTAMIGYEWTSVPKGNNLHRNILFRDGKSRADQIFPFSCSSARGEWSKLS